MNMKIIAFYLPQFHSFPENDKWWGKGFTEWTSVRNSISFYDGHNQPATPLNNNYYNLTDPNTLRWQAKLAHEYGVYGFCFYHYWFDGKMLMEKPAELLLENKDIDMPFCFSWANENWTRSWADKSKELLISQTYGNRDDWENHFNYLYSFFTDSRYIYMDNKPVLIIYRPEIIPTLSLMLDCWNAMAKKRGLEGICFIYQRNRLYNHLKDKNGNYFSYGIEYQPDYIRERLKNRPDVIVRKLLNVLSSKFDLPIRKINSICYSYDAAWKKILKSVPIDDKMFPGAFVAWDNTPRYKRQGSIFDGFSVEKFEKYLTYQIVNAKTKYHKEYLFLFAWNEWGEGGYLEPDQTDHYGRLQAVKNALLKASEYGGEI